MKIEIKSSNMKSVDYDEKEEKLIIEFIGGSKYQYDKLSLQLYKDFMEAESKGKFFHKNIKSQFIGKKIEQKHQCNGCLYSIANFCTILDKIVDNYSSCKQYEPIAAEKEESHG